MLVILDTHAVLWWTLEPPRLGRAGTRAIAQAERVGVPAIAFWETAVLVRKGKLRLDIPVDDWADRLLAIPRVECLPIDERISLTADTLQMHADPADRFIVATALERRGRLITKDGAIRRMKLVDTVW
ncbi:MAG TPA: type II toxin-antitoxin system VapC family toxin [Polyangia bacterium]|nr:type II toxin-antitoxin system VapC family toxin [Polyangia bacterium]